MAESIKLPKPKYGQIVVLQKNGDEPRGHGFPLVGVACTIGRSETCDIRVSSAEVSTAHCRVVIEETTGEASLEILGINTEINGSIAEPDTKVKLKHKDVIIVGGRRLRFEYLPPDYKPKPGKVQNGNPENLKAEVVDTDVEVADPVEPEAKEAVPVPATPGTAKKVSFGPYLSPEQFDNNLPPATPVKRGATPRRSIRYSGLKFSRPPIESVIEEQEAPKDDETSKVVVEETVLMDGSADSTTEKSVDEDVPDASSMASGDEASEVSNVSVLPSECCSYLDDSISVDLSSISHTEEVVVTTEMEFMEPPSVQDTPVASPSEKDAEDATPADEQVIEETVSTSVEQSNGDAVVVEPIANTPKKTVPQSPQADYTDVTGVKQLLKTPKPAPDSPKADYSDVDGVKKLLQTPKPAPESPKADYSDVGGVKKLMQPETPMADYSDVAGVKKLMQTPKAAPASPDVEGVKDLMKTPKPQAVATEEELVKTPEVVTVATALTATDQDDETPKRGASTRRQSTRTPRATTTSPKAEFTESQAPPAALMAGDDEEDESPAEQSKEPVGEPQADEPKLDEPVVAEVTVSKTSEADSTVKEPEIEEPVVDPVEATPKRGGRRSIVASATKSTTRSRRSKAAQEEQIEAEQQQVVDEPKDVPEASASVESEQLSTTTTEKVVEPVGDGPNEETAPQEPQAENKQETGEETQEPTTTEVASEECKQDTLTEEPKESEIRVEEKVEAPTPRRGGRRTAATPKAEIRLETPKSTRSRRGQKVEPEPAVQEDVDATADAVPSSSQEEPAKPVEAVASESTKAKPDDDTEPADKNEQAEEAQTADDVASPVAATPRRGGRKPPVASAAKSATRSRVAQKAEPEQPVQQEPEVPQTESKDPVSEEPASVDDSVAEKSREVTEQPADVEETTADPVEPVPVVPVTPKRGGRKAPVASVTKSATRSRGSTKVEPEQPVQAQQEEPPVPQVESKDSAEEQSGQTEDSDVAVESSEVAPKPADVDDKAEEPVQPEAAVEATPKRGGRRAPVASVTKSATRSRGGQSVEPEKPVQAQQPEEESQVPASQQADDSADERPAEVSNAEESSDVTQKPADAEEKSEEPVQPEAAVETTPKRGGRRAPVASATKSATRSRGSQKAEPEEPEVAQSEQKDSANEESAETTEDVTAEKTCDVTEKPSDAEEKSDDPVEPVPAVEATPRRGGRRAPVASASKSTTRSRGAQKVDPVEQESSDVPQTESSSKEETSERAVAETAEKEESQITEEPAVAATPKRGGRKAAAASATKASATKAAPRSRRGKAEEQVAEAPEEPQQPTEEPKEAPEEPQQAVEAQEQPKSATRLKRGRAAAAPKDTQPAGRAKRGRPASAEPEEPQQAVEEPAEDVSDVFEAEPTTPKRGGRKAPAAKATRSKKNAALTEEPVPEAEPPSETVEEEKAPTPKRGTRKGSETEASESPKTTRFTRAKRGSESDAADAEEVAKEIRPTRSKRGKKDSDSDDVAAESAKNPVVRLTRLHVPSPAEKAPVARKTRGRQTKAEPEPIAEEEPVEEIPEKEPEAEKPAVRKGRGRGAKAAEEPADAKPAARRGQAASTDSETQDTEAKKATTRRGAAATKRGAAAVEEPAEPAPVEEKKRRGAKKPLDDLELKHEGKGHAADIHANHVPDDGEEDVPPARTTRGKKVVHFDVPSPSKQSPGKTPVATSPTVLLERDPELDKKAAATKEQEAAPKSTKRTRAKEVVQEAAHEEVASPAKAKRPARGGKKAEPEAAEEQAPSSPRRTRRTRN